MHKKTAQDSVIAQLQYQNTAQDEIIVQMNETIVKMNETIVEQSNAVLEQSNTIVEQSNAMVEMNETLVGLQQDKAALETRVSELELERPTSNSSSVEQTLRALMKATFTLEHAPATFTGHTSVVSSVFVSGVLGNRRLWRR